MRCQLSGCKHPDGFQVEAFGWVGLEVEVFVGLANGRAQQLQGRGGVAATLECLDDHEGCKVQLSANGGEGVGGVHECSRGLDDGGGWEGDGHESVHELGRHGVVLEAAAVLADLLREEAEAGDVDQLQAG